ncbi:MAG: cysteine--tRNA ligase [Candidatus Latescibacteria bacterium]|jgi:cysteinyl-tRNA synthetase|nr:cysteine--tRNA ligase [Candidatus Latescibacterota bacterium]
MAISFYNTLTRQKEPFKEIEPGKVRFYTCGPTVYDFAHIGNQKTFIVYDLIKRYLSYRGYEVNHIVNITDVEDKIISRIRDEGISREELTGRYEKAFFEDMDTLNILPADRFPRATEHIPEMVEMVGQLIEDGHAYKRGGSVYFSIPSFPTYGELARLDVAGLRTSAEGVDEDEYDKENARDFVLWKAWKDEDGEVFWETDLGKGRPGWHMECSCMAIKYLGETIDIHGGGVDLVFPHHQNEIAQSEALTGKPFANTWIHSAFINVDDEKMSKSLGNFLTIRDVVNSPDDARAFRYLVASSHYRTAFNFSAEVLEGAKSTMRHLTNFRRRLAEVQKAEGGDDVTPLVRDAREAFVEHMDDDLNSPNAMAAVFGLVSDVEDLLGEERMDRKGADLVDAFMDEINEVLGIFYTLPEDEVEETLPDDLLALIAEREEARKEKNWARSDEIRDQFTEMGYVLEDTPDGTAWKKA